MPTETVQVDSTRLSVLDQGRGRPVLFAHGFPLDHTMWRFQIEAISQEYRVIAPDLRGFGASDVTPGAVAMSQFADDLALLLDALQVQEPVTFCGLSMGGYIAWSFAQRHAQRLDRLILCDTRAQADAPDAARDRLAAASDVEARGVDDLADLMVDRLFCAATQARHPERVKATQATMLATDPAGVAAALRGMAQREDATPRLPDIHQPCLVICGQDDQISPVQEMREIAAALPQSDFFEAPDAGHMAPLENPQLVNRAIQEFLNAW